MNRKERREIIKKYGIEALKAFSIVDQQVNKESYSLTEGTLVTINDESVSRGNSKRNRWVDKHIGDIFSIEYDSKWGEKPCIYCLAEDETEPKWYFTKAELIVLKQADQV